MLLCLLNPWWTPTHGEFLPHHRDSLGGWIFWTSWLIRWYDPGSLPASVEMSVRQWVSVSDGHQWCDTGWVWVCHRCTHCDGRVGMGHVCPIWTIVQVKRLKDVSMAWEFSPSGDTERKKMACMVWEFSTSAIRQGETEIVLYIFTMTTP